MAFNSLRLKINDRQCEKWVHSRIFILSWNFKNRNAVICSYFGNQKNHLLTEYVTYKKLCWNRRKDPQTTFINFIFWYWIPHALLGIMYIFSNLSKKHVKLVCTESETWIMFPNFLTFPSSLRPINHQVRKILILKMSKFLIHSVVIIVDSRVRLS